KPDQATQGEDDHLAEETIALDRVRLIRSRLFIIRGLRCIFCSASYDDHHLTCHSRTSPWPQPQIPSSSCPPPARRLAVSWVNSPPSAPTSSAHMSSRRPWTAPSSCPGRSTRSSWAMCCRPDKARPQPARPRAAQACQMPPAPPP